MSDRLDLGTALAAIERVAWDAPPAEVATLVGEIERVKAIAWARLFGGAHAAHVHLTAAALPPYTLREAAALIRKGPAWLRHRAGEGRVPGAQKVGRSWLFRRAQFDRFRERGTVS